MKQELDLSKVENDFLKILSDESKNKISKFKDIANSHFKTNKKYEINVPTTETMIISKLFGLQGFETNVTINGLEAKIDISLSLVPTKRNDSLDFINKNY